MVACQIGSFKLWDFVAKNNNLILRKTGGKKNKAARHNQTTHMQ
jgi:hypothetical protein